MLKKLTTLFLIVVLLFSNAAFPSTVSATTMGDIDGNGYVDSADYIMVKRFVLGTKKFTAAQKKAADVDGDGDVDRIDYVTIKRMALNTLDSLYQIVGISYSKSYTTSVGANDAYPDENNMTLTDGDFAVSGDYSNSFYVGYTSDVDICIALGNEGTSIKGFELSYLNTSVAGIYSPDSFKVYGGNSPTTCDTELCSKTVTHVGDVNSRKSIRVNLRNTVDYSYIRFAVKKSYNGAWMFIDEAVIYGVVSADATDSYDYYALDTLTDTDRASQLANVASSQAYDSCVDTTSISKNCSYSINCSGYDQRLTYNASYLTDGKNVGTYFSDKAWVGMNANSGVTVTVTLNRYSTINDVCGFAVHCFNRPTASIVLPDYVDVSVSKDGYTYYTVGRVYAPKNGEENHTYGLYFKTLISAKYVNFTFPKANGYLWIEEVEVLANRTSSATEISTTGYLSPDSGALGGAKDIALIYHNSGAVTQDMLLPYVAYMDDNGNVLDTMFDGFLFLPNVGEMLTPGSTPYGTNTLADWNWMFDEIFKDGYCLDALDKVANRVKFLLGKPSLKLKVFITIPHLDTTVTDFGDVDGDGISENLGRLDVRVYVAKLFAQRVIDKFASESYENLELSGFYWFHEAIAGDDIDTVKSVNNSFDYLGLPLFWIPYFNASGFLNGYDYGFDAVCLQPNYAFSIDIDESRLQVASNYAKQKGMCIEMEICSSATMDIRFFKKYMDYLSGGVKYGYMDNSIHAYYQEFDIIGASRTSENQRNKLIYKYTYDFIKGKLDTTPDVVSTVWGYGKTETPFSGTVNKTNVDTQIYQLSGSPSHGSVSFSSDGSFVYYPNKGFKGKDTFTYKISNYLGWSNECTVNIRID